MNRDCAACGESVREVTPGLVDPCNGHIRPGVVRITVQKRITNPHPFASQTKELSETKRYCPDCSAIIETFLHSLGFELTEPKEAECPIPAS